MLLWIIVTIVTAIACAALYYAAAGRMVNAGIAESGNTNRHFQHVLAEIDADQAAGKLGEAEALAAKGELAREILRQKAESATTVAGKWRFEGRAVIVGVVAVAALALGVYGLVGSPNLPGRPYEGRADVAAQSIDVGQAVARIEAQLAAHPDDLRGWKVLAPVYMQAGRYADAEKAYRRILDLSEKTAAAQIDLAEALLMQAGGDASGEPMTLLRSAAALDPTDVRSRFYIASELTRAADYPAAVPAWQELLALSSGNEPWVETAQQGLRLAQADGNLPSPPAQIDADQSAMIKGMVGSLADRLDATGGPIEDWVKLVRSYLVLGDTASAQSAYDRAVLAYPKTFDRADLDSIAVAGGLQLNGAKP